METLFESYVAALLKKHLAPLGYSVSAQDKSYYLILLLFISLINV